MSRHHISDDLLNTSIGIKRESGVSDAQIHDLIEKYASDSSTEAGSEGIVGFLTAEDVPAAKRAAFLGELSALMPPPSYEKKVRMISAAEIWQSRVESAA